MNCKTVKEKEQLYVLRVLFGGKLKEKLLEHNIKYFVPFVLCRNK